MLSWVMNESAPAGKELKYARRERERRFLLAGQPDGPVVGAVHIADRFSRGQDFSSARVTSVGGDSDRVVY
jgi:hypothetical protein